MLKISNNFSDFDEKSEEFNLRVITDLNLQRFADDIRDISNAAVMETQVETNINNIISTWLDLKLDVVIHKDMDFKIQNVDDCFQVLKILLITFDL